MESEFCHCLKAGQFKMLCRRYMLRLEIDIKMHCKLIVLPLVLLISFSFAANSKKDEGVSASEKNIPPADTDDDEDLIPGVQQPDDDYEYEDGSDEIDAADQPAAEDDEPESNSKDLNGYVPVKKGNLVTTLSAIPAEYVISFSVRPTAFSSGYSSVLHFTTGGNYGKFGYRIPGVWINKNKLHICGSVKGSSNYCYNSKPLAKNKWTDVTIVNSKVGSKYWYKVIVNGKLLGKVVNPSSRVYKNVKVYVTDPWYKPFRGSLRNIKISAPGLVDPEPFWLLSSRRGYVSRRRSVRRRTVRHRYVSRRLSVRRRAVRRRYFSRRRYGGGRRRFFSRRRRRRYGGGRRRFFSRRRRRRYGGGRRRRFLRRRG